MGHYDDWVYDRGLENEDWVHDRWGDDWDDDWDDWDNNNDIDDEQEGTISMRRRVKEYEDFSRFKVGGLYYGEVVYTWVSSDGPHARIIIRDRRDIGYSSGEEFTKWLIEMPVLNKTLNIHDEVLVKITNKKDDSKLGLVIDAELFDVINKYVAEYYDHELKIAKLIEPFKKYYHDYTFELEDGTNITINYYGSQLIENRYYIVEYTGSGWSLIQSI